MHLKVGEHPEAERFHCYLDGKKVMAVEAHEEEGWALCYTRGGRPALVREEGPFDFREDGLGLSLTRFEGHVMLLPCPPAKP